MNEFQDESNESNESLEPQADTAPADDTTSQDSAPEEVGNDDVVESAAEASAQTDAPEESPAEAPEAAEESAEQSAEEETPTEEAPADEAEQQPEAVEDSATQEEEVESEAAAEVETEEADEDVPEEEIAEESADAEPEANEESEEAPSEEVVEEETVEEVEPEAEASADEPEDDEDAPFDPNNIPKKYDSQTFEWYILKVQVNRETSIRDGLLRRIKMEGLEEYFEDVIVPTEDIVEFTRSGKRKVVKRKLYPGYIMVNMMLQDDSWFLVRETPGIGDFTGTFGKPTPMPADEVERILTVAQPEEDAEGDEPQLKTAIPFKPGDRVRVKDGNFQNFEGEVDVIDEANGRVTLIINIFGRSTPVELEHWQIEEI